MNKTAQQYDQAIKKCRDIFAKKTKDYGTAWRILRTKSLTDQIFIKANRIRSIEEAGEQKIDDPIIGEFIGIINYSSLALVQLKLKDNNDLNMDPDEAIKMFDHEIETSKQLMLNKNHDYGEAWRDMRVSSMTDLILMKLLRVKQIEDNDGKVLISEGLDANYQDIINYAVFALIKLAEEKSN